MIDYRKLGFVSEKQHLICEWDEQMIAEHVITREGFSDAYSILYQKRAPTHEISSEIYQIDNPFFLAQVKGADRNLTRQHLQTFQLNSDGGTIETRMTLLANSSCTVGVSKQSKDDELFFCNSDADELYFVAQGQGTLQTIMGEIDYVAEDYLFIPKSIPYRFLTQTKNNMLVVEGKNQFGIPKEFRNQNGQIKLDAPYNHRDFRSPNRLANITKNIPIIVKRHDQLTIHKYTDFPYQVVGWDGWYWPFAFSVSAYQPKTSSVHLPPSVHAVFSGKQFYVMNFVPRLLDYHPKAVPCPWPHSNIDCDEVLFYVRGDFTSRKGISQYSISFHPAGIPHGPHPGKYEGSLGLVRTEELAIMVDTFEPLHLTEAAMGIEDKKYHLTWDSKEGV